jgi:hypothetical protein
MRSSRRVAAAATLLTLTAFLAGCGDDGDKDGKSDEPRETVTVDGSETPSTDATDATEETSAPTTDASVTPMDPTETSDITQAQVEAALLTPEEVAPGLVLGSWSNDDTPPPCDPTAEPADVQVPPAVESGVQINTADGNASMEEEIAIFATEEEASEAFGISSGGLDCSTATLDDGSTVTIGPASDVTAEVNGASALGESTQWEISGDGYSGVLIATIAGRIVMANTFVVAEGADTSTLPTPIDIAAQAWAKALAS